MALLVNCLPYVALESCFALKGGTAINLFINNFPRLSVDIDLAYLPLEPREQALKNVRAALDRIRDNLNKTRIFTATLQDNRPDEMRIIVESTNNIKKGSSQIKIEVSPVARGTLHDAASCDVIEEVEDEFGFVSINTVSIPDLYGGKICAAMDRQHPSDLFDVKELLEI